MPSVVDWLLLLAALPVAAGAVHLGALALLAWRLPPPPPVAPRLRFAIVVPARDEELGIARTVRGLLELDYPRELFEVVVVADNCSDATAERARRAGATVLERHDRARQGKGYALAYAFDRLPEGTDVAVVIDADSSASKNVLSALAGRFEAGAQAVQIRNHCRNPLASWRTRLMTLALASFHRVRGLARERIGVSCGLHGNGMAFSRTVLELVPFEAHSLAEDLEYAVALALSGFRVTYADEAEVLAETPSTGRTARSQRQRWETGRKAIARAYRAKLLSLGVQRRSGLLLDAALDLLLPPLSTLVVAALAGLLLSGFGSFVLDRPAWTTLPWAASCLLITAYVLRGATLSGLGPRALLDLAWAPLYVAWRIGIRVVGLGKPRGQWVRTARSRQST